MQYVLINIMIFLTLYIELLHEIYISYGNVCCFDPQALIYTYVHKYKKKKKLTMLHVLHECLCLNILFKFQI